MMWARRVVAARGEGQDRAVIRDIGGGLVIAVADGAGGTSHGARAAQAVMDLPIGDPEQLLTGLDGNLGGGQTTAVVMTIAGGVISGASVGDSIAWLIPGPDLTAHQQRKPLLGDGAIPIPFRARMTGTLLVATDGLWKDARRADIERIATGPDLDAAADALVDLVRPLQDDVTVVLIR